MSAYDHLIFLRGLCGYVWVNLLTSSPLRVTRDWNFSIIACMLQTALSAMTTRVMTYAGEFEPVKWTCRAPLPNGKLCPRMDRQKCPFHGKIIGRDKMGNPTDPKDIAELAKLQEKKNQGEIQRQKCLFVNNVNLLSSKQLSLNSQHIGMLSSPCLVM